MEGLSISDIIIHIVNVLVLFVLLRIILFKPVNKFLSERSERIANQLREAEAKKAEALKIKADYERNMKAHVEEGQKLIRDSQVKAAEEANLIVQDARLQAEKLIEDAHIRIKNEKALVAAEARSEISIMATDIAARVLKREISVSDNNAIVEAFFRKEQP